MLTTHGIVSRKRTIAIIALGIVATVFGTSSASACGGGSYIDPVGYSSSASAQLSDGTTSAGVSARAGGEYANIARASSVTVSVAGRLATGPADVMVDPALAIARVVANFEAEVWESGATVTRTFSVNLTLQGEGMHSLDALPGAWVDICLGRYYQGPWLSRFASGTGSVSVGGVAEVVDAPTTNARLAERIA